MREIAQTKEIAADNSTLSIIRAKGQRFGFSIHGEKAFAKIQEISGVPDLGAAFATGVLSPNQIFALRSSKHGLDLRDWFDRGSPTEDSEATVRRFVEQAQQEGVGQKGWVKVLRLVSTAALGVIGPVTGVIGQAADSYFFDKWRKKGSPKLFLDKAKKVLSDATKPPFPTRNKIGRNEKCPCGSAKKFKHCCGP